MRPQFEVSIGGSVISGPLMDRNMSITVVDQEGTQSDSCTIVLDDRDGLLEEPEKNDILSVRMGYVDQELRDMGQFKVDETTLEGWPQKLTIKARAADLVDSFKEQRYDAFHNKTVNEIVSEIAKRNGMSASVLGSVGGVKTSITQDGVSDMHLLTQLGKKFDAVASPKAGKIIFAKKGEMDLGTVTLIHPLANIKSYSRTRRSRSSHQKAKASYWDRDKVKLEHEEKSSSEGTATYGEQPYQAAGKEDAKEVSKSRADALSRAQENLSMELMGNTEIMAEMKADIRNLRAGVDKVWRIKSANHTIDGQTFSTSFEAELPK